MGTGNKRNQLCICGSGNKSKKCCNRNEADVINASGEIPLAELERLHRNIQEKQTERSRKLRSIGIFTNFVNPIIYQGHKVWALGNKLFPKRPKNETFHEFLLFILIQHVLGKEWWSYQAMLSENERHHIYISFENYKKWAERNQRKSNKKENGWSAYPDGWSRSLISLAFDVASLVHTHHLPEDMLHRLKSYDEYQSVRYEIAVASIFARLGYRIEFLNEQHIRGKHCEFYAHDEISKETIGVEAKSKERGGVLHTDGVNNGDYWAHIRRAYRKAMDQNPGDRPFIIFFDINAPQAPDVPPLEKPWVKEVKELHRKMPLNTPQNPDPCSGEVFTNYSFHYQEEKQATAGEYLLTVPMYSEHPVTRKGFWNALQLALNNYGNVPNLDIEYGE